MKPEDINSYVEMWIESPERVVQKLVWCSKQRGWRRIESAEDLGFRDVLKLTSRDAWNLRDQFLESGYFGGQSYERYEDIQFHVNRLSDRPIYFLFAWDVEEGCTKPTAKIRCESMYQARKYFARAYRSGGKGFQETGIEYQVEHQVKHISDCLRMNQTDFWIEKLSNLDLEADLIHTRKT
ncbi:hypothetical protein ACQ4M3_07750 [Leptolyngbya sp. AN03gr2]|uniref:hypothetical protein n=1 Tax=unclassified Leptolyngbya TaxID=2650499 RepID=UPI003D319C89